MANEEASVAPLAKQVDDSEWAAIHLPDHTLWDRREHEPTAEHRSAVLC